MSHITYRTVADDLLYGSWGQEAVSANALIKQNGHSVMHTALLIGVLAELRKLNNLLGCTNFVRVPGVLREIEKNTRKRRRRKSKKLGGKAA